AGEPVHRTLVRSVPHRRRLTASRQRSSTQDVTLPEFSDRIIFEPVFELIGVDTAVRRLTLMGLGRDDLGRLETVEEGLRLRSHDDLRLQRLGAHQAGDDLESVGMKTEFRLIKN